MFKAVVDANALYPLYLRDLLLDFSQVGAYQVCWSRMILDEVRRALDRRRPEHAKHHAALHSLMNEAFPGALLKPTSEIRNIFGCRDPKDEHVMAAAAGGHAQVIITFNLRDFPRDRHRDHGIAIVHPDDFLLSLLNGNEPMAILLVARRLGMYSRPNLDATELANRLEKCACPKSADWIRRLREEIELTASSTRP